jgi:hypothetical protein
MSIGIAAGALATGLGASAGVSAIASAVAPSLLGGLMGSDSAESAYGAQEQGATQANATLKENYANTRKDFAPYLATGNKANNALAYALGIGGTAGPTREQMYEEGLNNLKRRHAEQYGVGFDQSGDEAGKQAAINQLNADIDQRFGEMQAGQPDRSTDPNYGMLTRQFGADDLAKDLTYQNGLQFGLDEGAKGINNMAAATGKQLSGATLKALTRFGNDYGTTKTAGASDRFTQRQNQIYNMYSGTSQSGQQAAGSISQAGQAAANGVANNQTSLGNARGAAEIAQGNSWSGALSGAGSAIQGNKLLDAMSGRGSSGIGNGTYSGYGTYDIPMQPGGGY